MFINVMISHKKHLHCWTLGVSLQMLKHKSVEHKSVEKLHTRGLNSRRGALGPIRNRKTGQNFHQNRKTGRKLTQNRKNAENNDQNCKFVILSPSTLDTTAKILALGTIQCPCYTACSANLIRIIPKTIFAMFNQRNRFFHWPFLC